MAGIVGYGAYIPRNRIKAEEIARQWGKDPGSIRRGLKLEEKSVPGLDEDTITISVEAGRDAIERAGIDPTQIGAVYIGSESHPYAVKPSGTVLIDALGIGPEVHVADFEFACKAGTEAMFVALGLVESGRVDYAMGVGADTSQGAPNDALEVRHGGRFTGEPAYFKHVESATRGILKRTGMQPADFKFVVFHMPNGKFPLQVGKTLGFTHEQLETGWIVPTMGNTYSGSSPTGLAAILDVADAGDKILITSFGSGAGSDSFVLEATDLLAERRQRGATVRSMLDGSRHYLTYGEYAKLREKIILNEGA